MYANVAYPFNRESGTVGGATNFVTLPVIGQRIWIIRGHVLCCSTNNKPRLYPPNLKAKPHHSPRTTKPKPMILLRDGERGVLSITALRKLTRFAFRIRDQAR